MKPTGSIWATTKPLPTDALKYTPASIITNIAALLHKISIWIFDVLSAQRGNVPFEAHNEEVASVLEHLDVSATQGLYVKEVGCCILLMRCVLDMHFWKCAVALLVAECGTIIAGTDQGWYWSRRVGSWNMRGGGGACGRGFPCRSSS